MKAELLHGFYLDNYLVDPLRRQVIGPRTTVRITPKASEVLLQLAAAPGTLLSREFLIGKVWGDGRGSPEALSKVISEIRHALGDSAANPRVIQTLPGRGYRLIPEPRPSGSDTASIVIGAGDGPGVEELGFLENLQQRGVFEAALAYLVIGWLIIQIADVVFDQLLMPQWVGTFVTVLVIAGFPLVLALSWLLEYRDGRASLDTGPDARHPRRRFSRAYFSVVGALAISGVAVFAYHHFVGLPEAEPAIETAETVAGDLLQIEQNSIAVLRFLNIDGSDTGEVFASGFAEGMITQLARLPSLLVASRTDAWSLGTSSTSGDVRRRLRVAYFIEGSVQLIADKLRVNVKLVDSATGFQLTTRTFEEPVENFNRVQRELIDLTIANLRLALPAGTDAVLESLEDDTELGAYILFRQGRELFEQPHTESSLHETIRLFEEALAFDPDYASAHAGICRTYVELYLASSAEDYINSAETACARALRANSQLPLVYTAMGDLYANTGRLGAAEQAFQTALEIDSRDINAMTGLADVMRQNQRYDNAESLLVDAVGKQPGNWRTINSLGNFLFSQGRYEDAADVYQQAVVLDPENFQVLSNLGSALLLAADFEGGRQVLEDALALQPNDNTYSNLGIVYYFLGDFDQSVAMHRRAAELAPGRAISWLNLADALHHAGDTQASEEAFARAAALTARTLAVNAEDPEALETRAWTQHMLGDDAAASASVARALAIDPGDPYGYYYKALLQFRSGDADAALESLERALELGYPANFLVAEPYFGELRADPRFHAMLAASFQ
mgnify:CR=1 FL=1